MLVSLVGLGQAHGLGSPSCQAHGDQTTAQDPHRHQPKRNRSHRHHTNGNNPVGHHSHRNNTMGRHTNSHQAMGSNSHRKDPPPRCLFFHRSLCKGQSPYRPRHPCPRQKTVCLTPAVPTTGKKIDPPTHHERDPVQPWAGIPNRGQRRG